jgi:hypothetical protein
MSFGKGSNADQRYRRSGNRLTTYESSAEKPIQSEADNESYSSYRHVSSQTLQRQNRQGHCTEVKNEARRHQVHHPRTTGPAQNTISAPKKGKATSHQGSQSSVRTAVHSGPVSDDRGGAPCGAPRASRAQFLFPVTPHQRRRSTTCGVGIHECLTLEDIIPQYSTRMKHPPDRSAFGQNGRKIAGHSGEIAESG